MRRDRMLSTLPPKDGSEILKQEAFSRTHIRRGGGRKLGRERRDALVYEAARVHEGEIAEVGGDIERKAVHGDEAATVHPDGADLTGPRRVGIDPYTSGASHAASADAETRQEADDGLF